MSISRSRLFFISIGSYPQCSGVAEEMKIISLLIKWKTFYRNYRVRGNSMYFAFRISRFDVKDKKRKIQDRNITRSANDIDVVGSYRVPTYLPTF